jgi:hypothetical protein
MQKLHCRVAETPIGLNGERDEAAAVGLHSCVRRLLLLVPVRGCGPCGGRGTREGVDGKWVDVGDGGDVGDGDPAGQHHEDVAAGLRGGSHLQRCPRRQRGLGGGIYCYCYRINIYYTYYYYYQLME